MSPWVQGLRSATVVAEQTSPGRLATHLPRGYGHGRAGAHGSKVSAPLRSLQSRRPLDVLQPIFRKAPVVVVEQAMVQGLASGSVGSWHEVPRTSLGLRSAPVVAGQALYNDKTGKEIFL